MAASSSLAALALAGVIAAPTGPSMPTATAPTSAIAPSVTSPRRDALPRPTATRRPTKRLSHKGLRGARAQVAVGGAMLGVFYLAGTGVAASVLDDIAEDGRVEVAERDERRAAQLMFMPVVGPLASAALVDDKGEKAAMIGYGLLQGLGVAMMVIGSVSLVRDRRARRLELAGGPMAGGGTIGLRGRF